MSPEAGFDAGAGRVSDLSPDTIQAWMDAMASDDLALSTMRSRQSTLSSLCNWLVKRSILSANPVAKLDRPPHRKETPRQVPDELVHVGKQISRVSLPTYCFFSSATERRGAPLARRSGNVTDREYHPGIEAE